MMKFYLVDVKNITSDVSQSNFSESDLDHLADMLLESGGIVKPLVLKATGAETYTVVDGHLGYHVAVRAQEKNPRQGEMVNAFVISSKVEDIVVKQATLLKEIESLKKPGEQIFQTNALESRLANLELRLEKQINELKSELTQERQRLDDKFKQIEEKLPKQISPLQVFNGLEVSQLVGRLKRAGFTNKKAESVEKERKKKQFASLSDVVKRVKITSGKKQVTAISSDKMVDIIDSLSSEST
jgi:uncharacterized coiled-coil protein SlyX